MHVEWWKAWICVNVFAALTVGLRLVSKWLGDKGMGDDAMIFRALSDTLALATFVVLIAAVVISIAAL